MKTYRDGGGAPVRPGAGGEGGGVGRSQAPRDRFSSHGGNRNANAPTDGGEAEFNMDAVDLSDMKVRMTTCVRGVSPTEAKRWISTHVNDWFFWLLGSFVGENLNV